MNLLHNLLCGVFGSCGGKVAISVVPILKLGEDGKLRDAHRVVVRVHHGERDSAIFSNDGNGGADEHIEPVLPDPIAERVQKDGSARRHRGRDANSDDHLETTSRDLDILRRESKGADGGGKRF